jgi:hypothetical protein
MQLGQYLREFIGMDQIDVHSGNMQSLSYNAGYSLTGTGI